jgi:hypothetical protein
LHASEPERLRRYRASPGRKRLITRPLACMTGRNRGQARLCQKPSGGPFHASRSGRERPGPAPSLPSFRLRCGTERHGNDTGRRLVPTFVHRGHAGNHLRQRHRFCS